MLPTSASPVAMPILDVAIGRDRAHAEQFGQILAQLADLADHVDGGKRGQMGLLGFLDEGAPQ